MELKICIVFNQTWISVRYEIQITSLYITPYASTNQIALIGWTKF